MKLLQILIYYCTGKYSETFKPTRLFFIDDEIISFCSATYFLNVNSLRTLYTLSTRREKCKPENFFRLNYTNRTGNPDPTNLFCRFKIN